MSRKFRMNVGLGAPSIMMIFVILCLTTLGALSLMTANADWKLSNKTAGAIRDYYDADSEAEEILANADGALKAGRMPETTSYRIKVSDHQEMILNLEVNGINYRVLSQKLVIKDPWNYEKYQTEYNDTIVE